MAVSKLNIPIKKIFCEMKGKRFDHFSLSLWPPLSDYLHSSICNKAVKVYTDLKGIFYKRKKDKLKMLKRSPHLSN